MALLLQGRMLSAQGLRLSPLLELGKPGVASKEWLFHIPTQMSACKRQGEQEGLAGPHLPFSHAPPCIMRRAHACAHTTLTLVHTPNQPASGSSRWLPAFSKSHLGIPVQMDMNASTLSWTRLHLYETELKKSQLR